MRGGSNMSKPNKKTAHTIGFMIIFFLVVIAVYYYVSTRTTPIFPESITNMTEIEALIAKDIEEDYPATPREVLKLYNRIMKSFHTLKIKDDEINQLAEQMYILYDKELKESNTYEEYVLELKVEITEYRNAGKLIMNDNVEASKEIFYWEDAGEKYASLSSSYTIKEDGDYTKVIEDFMLRKDAEGKWRILGFKLSDKTEINTVE
jgi:hypothetical protein